MHEGERGWKNFSLGFPFRGDGVYPALKPIRRCLYVIEYVIEGNIGRQGKLPYLREIDRGVILHGAPPSGHLHEKELSQGG